MLMVSQTSQFFGDVPNTDNNRNVKINYSIYQSFVRLKMVLKLFSLLPPKRRKNDLATLPGMNHPFSENNESDIISHVGC